MKNISRWPQYILRRVSNKRSWSMLVPLALSRKGDEDLQRQLQVLDKIFIFEKGPLQL